MCVHVGALIMSMCHLTVDGGLNLPAVYICRGGKPIQGLAVSLERIIISRQCNCRSLVMHRSYTIMTVS
ncbi:hypothetical protein NQZ68_002912 [Dissostichus eleginoides]|nr:hypothetical protein NQZ68_002912 [Dissostichus eleginoides]